MMLRNPQYYVRRCRQVSKPPQTTPAFTAQALAGGSSMRSEKQACGMRSSPPAAGLKTLSRARRRRTAAGALASADG